MKHQIDVGANVIPRGEALASTQELFNAIAAQPQYRVDDITSDALKEGFSIGPEPMVRPTRRILEPPEVDDTDVIVQSLHTVLLAGDRLFGIVNIMLGTRDDSDDFIVSEFNNDGERATIGGVISPWFPGVAGGLEVHRGRADFIVGKLGNRILLGDRGSKNGIQVIRMQDGSGPEGQAAQSSESSGLLSSLRRSVNAFRRPRPVPANPLHNNHDLWSPQSLAAKKAIERELGRYP